MLHMLFPLPGLVEVPFLAHATPLCISKGGHGPPQREGSWTTPVHGTCLGRKRAMPGLLSWPHSAPQVTHPFPKSL